MAPETISEADAEPPFTSTTTGRPSGSWRPVEPYDWCELSIRPRVSTIVVPGGTNWSETAIAWSSRPPPLNRRSRISRCMPWSLSSARARATSPPVEREKSVIQRKPVSGVSMWAWRTVSWGISARVTVTSSGSSRPGRSSVTVTSVPFGPLSFRIASFGFISSVGSPLIRWMMSPARMPFS